MQIDIDNLLSLPASERKKIAEKLWNSLDPVHSISREDKENIKLLENRWIEFTQGTSKSYTSSQLRKMIGMERKKG
ncbi:MAG: addiction module protein [Ginsengibacter sp.]|jgi:putative addiction module component (TIGR02574 family)